MTERLGRFLGLIIVTAAALAVAITITAGGWGRTAPGENDKAKNVIPPAPVSVMEVEREEIEITDTYSGMIRPFERFSLGFEIAGRVDVLGTNAADEAPDESEPLDEGDRVTAGQVLAKLDDQVLSSLVKEAEARVEDAEAKREKARLDKDRSEKLRKLEGELGKRAITDKEYQADVAQFSVAEAQLAMAKAQLPIAEKNLKDATLYSPVDGVISKRLVNQGESVNPHQVVMEIIQVDDVLLVVGVPEAYVGEIRAGQPVHVELLARDRYRRERARADGRVYQVAESADRTTGLFEVEIILPNPQRRWRPGLIATAGIVLRRVDGFRVPVECTMVLKHREALEDEALLQDRDLMMLLEEERNEVLFLYTIDKENKARRLVLKDWIEQGPSVVLLQLAPERRTVVARGQYRLVEGRKVLIIKSEGAAATDSSVAVGR